MDRSDPRLQRPPSVEALLRRRVIIGFILALLLTSLMGFLSWRSTRLAAQEADLVAHTHAVMGTLEVTVEHAIELETSARGFALTVNSSCLSTTRPPVPPSDRTSTRFAL